jgi:hypothetical protein
MGSNFSVVKHTSLDALSEKVLDFIRTLDIYYQPEFLICDAKMQGGDYELAIFENAGNFWVYPYIVVPIANTPYFDITSPYGYAGPAANDNALQAMAEQSFMHYIAERGNIVCEFVRYHPVYNEHLLFEKDISNLVNRRVVLVNTVDPNDIWMNQFSATNRNLVRKMENDNFTWLIKPFKKEDLPEFNKAYQANMVHSGATDYYFFPLSYFEELIHNIDYKLQIVHVQKDGVTYASALFFISGNLATYFLSARNLSFPKIPASNLLLSKMATWCVEHGISLLNLGGGLSLDESDHLFKFKSNFSKQIKNFHIGKRIHGRDLYKQLQENYILTHGEESYQQVKHILQFYRY